jgi:hypothetical protein
MATVDLGVVRPVIKGAFDPIVDYEVLNIVSHDGAWYIAKVPVPASLGEVPAIGSTVWDRVSPDTLSQAEGDLRYALKTDLTAAIDALVDASPGTLDTLNELAAALGDDPNFATTVMNSIATKLPLAGGTVTGQIKGVTPESAEDLAQKGYVDSKIELMVKSDIAGVAGADAIANIISLTQAEYDAITTPDASTFYVIVG